MGTAALVATAIGLALLVLTAYVLIEGSVVTATTLATAQSELSDVQEARLRTAISIRAADGVDPLVIEVENTGSEVVPDLAHLDIFIIVDGAPVRCTKGAGPFAWQINSISPDLVHPNQLDPGERMQISVQTGGATISWVQVTTTNGISASRYVV
ncbi:MAG: flagellar protein FlaF [Methanomicrobiales archaeon]|nr:flagellar protein FlaF [Methanomicrobiales archaeon]